MISRRLAVASALALPVASLLSRAAGAGAAVSTGMMPIPPVFTRKGLALSGYDAVAYFSDGGPIVGRSEHRLKWRGAIWQFASAEHRQAFEMDPNAYAPQFGGYCAYTVAEGRPRKAEPDLWTIHAGRLYLNYDATLQKLWRQDMTRYVAEAEKNWALIQKG